MKVSGLARRAFERIHGRPPVVAVVRLAGVIGMSTAIRGNLNLARLAGTIERAFDLRGLKAVALAVNSPGGSPVQSALIHGRIRALAAERELPVVTFAEDIAASGGYWLALAGDEIFAHENSIVGSIGVVSSGFGFHELLARLGIERRLHVQGEKKVMLDPFSPEQAAEVKRLEALQKDVFASFKEIVKVRRQGKLKAPERKLFSGQVWTGRQALELGLIDGLGDLRSVMRQRYGEKVKLRVVGAERRWLLRRLVPTQSEPPAGAWAEAVIGAVEARAMWARYGL